MNQKPMKLSKLIKRGVIKICPSCLGERKYYGHGAFGESEVTVCSRCGGDRFVLNFKNIKRET